MRLASNSPVTELPAADSRSAADHFASLLAFETDCWDVHASVKKMIGGIEGWKDEGFDLVT